MIKMCSKFIRYLLILSLMFGYSAGLFPPVTVSAASGEAYLVDDFGTNPSATVTQAMYEVFEFTGTWKLYSGSDGPDRFNNDRVRIMRTSSTAKQSLTYKTDYELNSFEIFTYTKFSPANDPGALVPMTISVSSDNVDYTPVTPEIHFLGGNYTEIVYEANILPAGARYLKMQIEDTSTSEASTNLQIGKVILNGPASPAASLPSGLVPEGSLLTLASSTVTSSVYYTTDGTDPVTSSNRLLYETPIPITERTTIRAYSSIDDSAGLRSHVANFSYITQNAKDLITEPIADAYADYNTFTSPFYSGRSVQAKGKGFSRYAFFKFDVSALQYGADRITLNLYGMVSDTIGKNSAIEVYGFPNNWGESNTGKPELTLLQPPKTPMLGLIHVKNHGMSWYEVDVTSYVRDKINANDPIISIAVRQNPSEEAAQTFFAAREEGTHIPFLKVTRDNFAVTPSITGATSEGFVVNFDPPVYGLSESDFALDKGVTVSRVVEINGGAAYSVDAMMTKGETYTLTLSRPGVNFGSPLAFVPADPVQVLASTSEPTVFGFNLHFDPPVVGLLPDDLTLDKGAAVQSVSSQDQGATYWVESSLSFGESYALTINKSGYVFANPYAVGPVKRSGIAVALSGTPLRTGFTVTLDPPVNGLTAGQFVLNNGASVSKATTTNQGASYALEANLTAGQLYRLTIQDQSYEFSTTELTVPMPAVDRYGQIIQVNFDSKVTGDDQLLADAAADDAYYSSLNPPERDSFGGMMGSNQRLGLTATGFFHVQNVNGKPVLVNPLGNLYFSLGPNVIDINESFTTVTGREHKYEELPPLTGTFAPAYLNGKKDNFSFYIQNWIRKFGSFNTEQFYDESVYRLKQWGFTGAGNWSRSDDAQRNNFPNVRNVGIGAQTIIEGTGDLPDVFASDFRSKVNAAFTSSLPGRKNDDTLIGYFFGNELHYEKFNTSVPKLSGSKPIKIELINWLKSRYGNDIALFNAAWSTSYADFDAALNASMTLTSTSAANDMYDFFAHYMDVFYGTVSELFKTHDPNHLLLGDRYLAGTMNNDRIRRIVAAAAGQYLDVISYNYYTGNVDKERLTEMHQLSGGKPIMITEFHYSEPTQGLIGGVRSVANETEKGKAYRSYVENLASLGFVVGAHWFSYLDQPPTGRWFQGLNGEAAAIGFINVADRPYKTMLSHVTQANYSIYELVLGEKEPYFFDYNVRPREQKRTLRIPQATGAVTVDGYFTPGEYPASTYRPLVTAADQVLGIPNVNVNSNNFMTWDETNLYVFADITDPTPMINPYTGSNVWNGDGIELFFGPDNLELDGALQYSDRQLVLSGGYSKNGNMNHWFFNTGTQSPISMALAPYEDARGYRIEAAIPWTALNMEPAAGREFRFDIGLDDAIDAEAKRRVAQWMWNGGDSNSGNRTGWGRAMLVTEAVAPGEISDPVVTPEDSKLTIAWNKPADADFHSVILYNGTERVGAVGAGDPQTITLSGLTNGQTYTYTIRTADTSGNESAGVTVTGIPVSSASTVEYEFKGIPEGGMVRSGAEFLVEVHIKNAVAITGHDVTVEYDGSRFEYVGGQPVEGLIIGDMDEGLDSVRFILASEGADNRINGSKQVLSLTFRAKEELGEGYFRIFRAIASNPDAQKFTAAPSDATVTVISHGSLEEAIGMAEQLLLNAETGTRTGQYIDQAIPMLQGEVAIARLVWADPQATQADYDNAGERLLSAIAKFNSLRVTATTGDIDGDGVIDIGDIGMVSDWYGMEQEHTAPEAWNGVKFADLNQDGIIGMFEIRFIAKRILGIN